MPSSLACRIVVVLCLSAVLAGCNDPSVERGSPPVPTVQAQRLTVPLYSYGAARRLREGIDTLAGGDPEMLRAVIRTRSTTDAQAARQKLIGDGCDPTMITVQAVPYDDIVLSRVDVHVASCRRAIDPGWLGDASNSLDSLGRCVQADNLAAMVAEPAELETPSRLEPVDGAVAAKAVIDWQKGDVRSPHPDAGNGDTNGGDAGGGDAGTGTTAGGAAGAPEGGGPGGGRGGNPLLAPGL